MWRVASGSSYRKKMSCSDSSYNYRDRGRKTDLTSWENNNNKRIPQQPKIPLMNNKEGKGCRLKLRHLIDNYRKKNCKQA